MTTFPSEFEHSFESLKDLRGFLLKQGADLAVLKLLPRNANDKNQVRLLSSFTSLHHLFQLTLAERGASSSTSKSRSSAGSAIPEAVFNEFWWVQRDERRIQARNVKAIAYMQYPEVRLSGFSTIENTMPASMSVTYAKKNPTAPRLLVLGRIRGGGCIGLMCVHLGRPLLDEVAALEGLEGSRVCKVLHTGRDTAQQLFDRLAAIVGRRLKGCRLNAQRQTLPFTGTQVCGYTLEHALGIVPNSGMDGDFDGIELKTHTQKRVTLFTPEPDFGLYAKNFSGFMQTYGYLSGDEYRVTGVHRAGIRCDKSGLTLKVREHRLDKAGVSKPHDYDPTTDLTAKLNAVDVVLLDDAGKVAAGWSLERLMNNWGAKHNEAVYLSAVKAQNDQAEEVAVGFKYQITYAAQVMWCRGTSAERLLAAIASGLIYLDPAPKFVPSDASRNKRRAQWRVAEISEAVRSLYEKVDVKDLSERR